MRTLCRLILLVSLIVLLFDSFTVEAQERKTIKCESRGSQSEYCRTNTQGRVRLERQLSDAPCRKYETWGTDRDGGGIWVNRGCRGVFVVEPYQVPPFSPGRPGQQATIKCESRGSQSEYCRTNTRGRVRLERQLSDATCREYETWGADRDGSGVWVSRGCRGIFIVEPFSYGPGRGPGPSETIRCESRGEQSQYCRTNTRGRVRLSRQLSDAPCRENETWGADWNGEGIWVDRGCRGEFVVEQRRR